MIHMDSVTIRGYIQELAAGAWTSIDVEAEINHIIYEKCKWEEHDHGF